MSRHPVIASLSILAGLFSLQATLFFLQFWVPGIYWLALYLTLLSLIPGVAGVAAGVLLLLKHRQRYLWATIAWILLILERVWTVAISFRNWDAWPLRAFVVEIIYLCVGVAVLAYLLRQRHLHETATGGNSAA